MPKEKYYTGTVNPWKNSLVQSSSAGGTSLFCSAKAKPARSVDLQIPLGVGMVVVQETVRLGKAKQFKKMKPSSPYPVFTVQGEGDMFLQGEEAN